MPQAGSQAPTLSLSGLHGLLLALEPELVQLSGLAPLWGAELMRELDVAINKDRRR